MRKTIALAACTAALAIPIADATAALQAKAAPKKKIVTITKTVTGQAAQADRWGFVQVALVVKKTTTIVGTDRSVFINQQALPLLVQETLSAQFTGGVNMISGASNTSDAFISSLQGALTLAHRV